MLPGYGNAAAANMTDHPGRGHLRRACPPWVTAMPAWGGRWEALIAMASSLPHVFPTLRNTLEAPDEEDW